MPAYFRFLTILAFHVFLQEKVSRQALTFRMSSCFYNVYKTKMITSFIPERTSLALLDISLFVLTTEAVFKEADSTSGEFADSLVCR